MAMLCPILKVGAQYATKPQLKNQTITGKVISASSGETLSGVVIKINSINQSVTSIEGGLFILNLPKGKFIVSAQYLGHKTSDVEIEVPLREALIITLNPENRNLQEVQINAGYYTVSERARTGNIQKITAATIEKQPISNPLQAMQNRVPGVQITQTTGVPGGGFNVQIRGRSSVNSQVGNDPLYIVDGVTYPSAKVSDSYFGNILGTTGASPLSMINPNDIESIEILKDADATAIYGSRGANGVILIKTKHGQSGKPKVNAGYTQGFSKVASHINLLNTKQYLEMRKEALDNDGETAGPLDYDVNGTYDPNKYTDWQKLLIGGTAATRNATLNFSGGTHDVNYRLGGTYYKEGTVYPGDFSFNRFSLQSGLNFGSEQSRLKVSFTTNYNHTSNNQIRADLTSYITLAPNAPDPYDQYGQLNWANNAVYQNPMALLLAKNNIGSDNLIGNVTITYKVLENLNFKTSAGYNLIKTEEFSKIPLEYTPPAYDPTAADRSSYFSNVSNRTWMAEPQLNYNQKLGKGKLDALIGMSFQENVSDLRSFEASNFSSNELQGNIAAASTIKNQLTSYSQYRYMAAFARINYSLAEKYYLNLTARRDGSSRFGSDKQFANFGAVGAAWIFSEEKLIKNKLSFLSFGKLRASYGVTGNDQIPDYGYLQLYNTSDTYQGISTIIPASSNIGNPNFAWETNYKLEFALQLGLFSDRLSLETTWYRNRSSNQLIGDPLPLSTGSLSVRANRPALVQNTGWEFLANVKLIDQQNWHWKAGINLTIPRNKLLAYPGIEQSSDATKLVIGQPLSITKIYHVKGVDSQTGLYDIEDYDGNGVLDDKDRYLHKFTGQYCYGGFQSALSYKNLSFDFLIGFTKQSGNNYIASMTSPGLWDSSNYANSNQPTYVLSRWTSPGQTTTVQKFSGNSNFNSPYSNARYFGGLGIGDASYLRLKNISLSCELPQKWLSKLSVNRANLTLSGQNLITITNYKGLDPETQSMDLLPPLKTWALGLNVTF